MWITATSILLDITSQSVKILQTLPCRIHENWYQWWNSHVCW